MRNRKISEFHTTWDLEEFEGKKESKGKLEFRKIVDNDFAISPHFEFWRNSREKEREMVEGGEKGEMRGKGKERKREFELRRISDSNLT